MCDKSQRLVTLVLLTIRGTLAGNVIFAASFGNIAAGQTNAPSSAPAMPGRLLDDRFFEAEVWAKVGERTCLRCHNQDGDAAHSEFVLEKPNESDDDVAILSRNRAAFQAMAKAMTGDRSRLLQKVIGELEHGGKQVLMPDSTGYKILDRYVQRTRSRTSEPVPDVAATDDHSLPFPDGVTPFFDGVTMVTPQRLLRRVTLSLAGRLPAAEELASVEHAGFPAIDLILDSLMQEDAFYARLKEGFNDIFLTIGIEDNAETLLSYDHFEKTRLWYQTHDFSHLPETERQQAGWKLADVYRNALLREPLELIAFIVRNERPFSELATADYIMVSPYTARGYGIYDEIKERFKNVDDPFEYIPAQLHALKGRDGKTQESTTGLYPHAGFLSMFHYLRRYPSTETNRNRLRARMFYQHFLGIDIMQLAPRSTASMNSFMSNLPPCHDEHF